ncbi:MAG TPA: two-component regulator propeller domain-containing protein, partial [Pyrinomonadaceae bacterium]|nr:two-component regulator propeller domain-containing protein [Pyrinomonadaceae bacterium]
MNKARGRSRHVIAPCFVLTCILLACCSSAVALNPALDVSQYAHTSWKIREGFTKGDIRSIAQTNDGYLWFGTEFGAFRFDGVRNVPWQPPADQPLPSNTTTKLLAARDGTLWIGTDKGLASWSANKLTVYPELAEQFVFALREDREGTVWVGTTSFPLSTGKLCQIAKGSVQCFGMNGEFGRGVHDLYEDRSGNLWVGSVSGVWRWKPGPSMFYPLTDQHLSAGMLGEADDGALLIVMSSGIQRLVDGKVEPYPLPKTEKQFKALGMLRDRDGGLWIGTSSGVAHVHQGRTDVFSAANGLSGDSVGTIFEDREGNIWIATSNGLDRFRNFAIPTFSISRGSSNTSVWSTLATRDGSILVTTNDGLRRWSNGQFAIYGTGTSQAQTSANIPYSLFQDSRSRIWVVTLHEFGYLENDRFISISGLPGGVVRSIAEDAKEDLWIANQNFGLFHLLRSKVFEQVPWDKLGHKDFAAALAV